MKVTYTVCPTCHKRKVLKHETDKLHTYTEKTIYTKCLECRMIPMTPEEKLLKAIHGER